LDKSLECFSKVEIGKFLDGSDIVSENIQLVLIYENIFRSA